MLTHDSRYRFSVGNSSGGNVHRRRMDGERGAGSKSFVDSQSTCPGGRSLGQVGESKQPPDRHGPDVLRPVHRLPGSSPLFMGAKT